jgi:hypothetical protein
MVMNPQQPSQPRGGLLGLFDKAMKVDDDTGLSPLQNFAAALDPLILKDLRGGQGIRQQGVQRAASMSKNKTVDMLRQQGRNDLADAVMNGTIAAKEAFGVMQSEKAADTAFQRQKDLAAFSAGLKAPTDSRTAQIKNYEYFLAQGKTPDEAAALAKTGDVFNLGGEKPSAFQLAQAKKQADTYASYSEGGMAAQDALNNLSIMEQLASEPGFYSGAMADQVLQVKRAAVAMGASPDLVESEETFNAIAKKTALDVMGGSLGVGFSNADRDFVTSMVPGLQNTPSGNAAIIDIQRKIQKRRIDLAVLADQYAEQNGNLSGFAKFTKDWAEENPLFPKAEAAASATSGGGKERIWDQSMNNGRGGFR